MTSAVAFAILHVATADEIVVLIIPVPELFMQ
jgi:hypothetical protein